jgi:hypothetical protein
MSYIEKLLAQSKRNLTAEICHNAFLKGEVIEIKSIDPMPISHVKNVYSLRSKINTMQGGKIKGYHDLLSELEHTKSFMAKIHLIKTEKDTFIVFTDDEESRLFGVLLIR